ncbi:MAG: aminotransferase class V-fold PLP-dependent enzyme, partial [Candidatus Omnitrophica bacterium]|nr:aminotransferase class V-fold PLP-dependent enzyme [Candidatus Omnitrophota bacterium]
MAPRNRWVLLNPGPVNVTEPVRKALLKPDLCHRESEFSKVLSATRQKLLKTFGIEKSHSAALLTGSGTLAVEAMLCSYGSGGNKVLVLSNGVYGDRLEAILKAHRIPHAVLKSPLGKFPDMALIEKMARRDPKIRAIAMVHHETSTGMLNPLEGVARIAKKSGKHLLVDAVSSLGAEKIDFRRWTIDLCAGSSGKCLHGFPGLSFVLVSKRGRDTLKNNRKPSSVYMDLAAILKAEDASNPPFTPAVQLFYALEEALDELHREGLSQRLKNYALKSGFLEKEFSRVGLEFVVEKPFRSHVLTALRLPAGLSYRKLHDELKKDRFVIYEGQSSLKGRIFRVANLGDVRLKDLKGFTGCLERVLALSRPASPRPKAIVLAAGVGKRLYRLTKKRPKCLIPLNASGENLLRRYFESFRKLGIKNVVIVCGYRKAMIKKECARWAGGVNVRFIENHDFRKGSVLSLAKAAAELDQDLLVMDADVYFPTEALERLLASRKPSAFLLDRRSKSSGEEMMLQARNGRLVSIAKTLDPALKSVGEATGIVKLRKKDALRLKRILERFVREGKTGVEYEESLACLLKDGNIGYETMNGFFWT